MLRVKNTHRRSRRSRTKKWGSVTFLIICLVSQPRWLRATRCMKYGGRAESEAGDGARTRRHRGVVTLQRGGTDVREEEEAR